MQGTVPESLMLKDLCFTCEYMFCTQWFPATVGSAVLLPPIYVVYGKVIFSVVSVCLSFCLITILSPGPVEGLLVYSNV